MNTQNYYISITGLRLKKPWHFFRFWWHAIPSMVQAKSTRGNVLADARNIKGVRHTLTVWESKQAMKAYIASGSHLKAMKVFDEFATGETYGFEANTIPTWDEARAIWEEKATAVTRKSVSKKRSEKN